MQGSAEGKLSARSFLTFCPGMSLQKNSNVEAPHLDTLTIDKTARHAVDINKHKRNPADAQSGPTQPEQSCRQAGACLPKHLKQEENTTQRPAPRSKREVQGCRICQSCSSLTCRYTENLPIRRLFSSMKHLQPLYLLGSSTSCCEKVTCFAVIHCPFAMRCGSMPAG